MEEVGCPKRCGCGPVTRHVHCKDVDEENLKNLRVANKKKLKFKDFMETFAEVATRIVDAIHLETFVEPARRLRNLIKFALECWVVDVTAYFGEP